MDGGVEIDDRLVFGFLLGVGARAIRQRIDVPRIQQQGGGAICDRIVPISAGGVEFAAQHVGNDILGIEVNCLIQIGQFHIGVAPLHIDQGAIVVGRTVRHVQQDDGGQVANGLVELVLLFINAGAAVVSGYIFGIDVYGRVIIFHRLFA